MYYTRGLPLTLYFPLLPRSVPDHGRVDPGAKKKKPCMMAGGLMFKACGLYIQSYSQDTAMKPQFWNMALTSNAPLAVSRLLKSFSWMKEDAFRSLPFVTSRNMAAPNQHSNCFQGDMKVRV